ncbi:MAG TPA: hypothetical protein VJN68_03945, partial [Burkholderiaceae bacterium]|nr:hypothetical protein [Burkholderiaceae bacterium]
MARHSHLLRLTPIAAAAWLAAAPALAQNAASAPAPAASAATTQQLAPVTVVGRATPAATIAGW